MACCVVALAMVYRLIDLWRRGKAWVGRVPSATIAICRPPRIAFAVIAVAVIELGFASGLVYQHRQHLTELGTRLLTNAAATADLCRSALSLSHTLQE
jgi:hypothetical protein